MSKKYVIGLTGNIATGKSIVRRMLKELDASTIDADQLVHVLQKPGEQVYRDIVETFGSFVLNDDATLNRMKLGKIVFNVPEALLALEKIVHPAVRRRIKRGINRAPTDVVVIEAIKLLEGELAQLCDEIWVVSAPESLQLERMMSRRRISREDALQRIRAQSPQSEKIKQADFVIDNSSGLIKTWNKVQKRFNKIPVVAARAKAKVTAKPKKESSEIVIRRARRDDLLPMAKLLHKLSQGTLSFDESAMMERFFSKGYFVAEQNGALIGIVGWQAENLVAGIDDLFVTTGQQWLTAGDLLMKQVEKAAKELSCEGGLVFLHRKSGPIAKKYLEKIGYVEQKPEALNRIWREAAEVWTQPQTTLLVKTYMKRIVAPL